MRARLLLPTLLVFALVAGCGGDDGLPAAEYRSRLDAACSKLAEASARIPQQMADEGLEMRDAQAIATRNAQEFEDAVHALEPPEELRAAHDRLIGLGDAPPPGGDELEALQGWMSDFADVYGDLGATTCERRQREALEGMKERMR